MCVEGLGAETSAGWTGWSTVSEQLLLFSGHLTGNWTIRTGQGDFVSPPKAKLHI